MYIQALRNGSLGKEKEMEMVLCIKTLGKCKILKEESGWFAYGIGSKGNIIGAVCVAPASCKTNKDAIAFIKANIDSSVMMVD